MLLYLFGGASEKTKGQQMKIIMEEMHYLKPKQILSIAFALKNRLNAAKKN